jgi:hypothetical protein|tara:strand:- start:1329 stop:2183 length:855 start_codon:yes stop_codon:yes gene_type:complete
MSDDILLKQILGPFKEYRKVQPKEEETIDDGTGVIKVLFFPVDDISANEFGYEWKMKTVKDEFYGTTSKTGVLRSLSEEEVTTRKGIRVSNKDGGYHSTPDFLQRLIDDEIDDDIAKKQEMAMFFGRFLRFLRKHVESFPSLKTPPPITTSWINRLSVNNSNGLHNHADAKLSGVFYFEDYEADVDAEWRGAKEPRPGDLLLRTASSAKRKNETVGEWCEYVVIRPQRGKLVLFEPNLLHGVVPSHRERFSLAMNFGEKNVSFEDPNEGGKKVTVRPISLDNKP